MISEKESVQEFYEIMVTAHDHAIERRYLNYVVKRVPIFQKINFVQSEDLTALFDFEGYNRDGTLAMTVEIKQRSIYSDQFDTYFISTEKYDAVQASPDIPHYIFYGFKFDKVLRIYDLSRLELVKSRLDFTHKRSGSLMSQDVYLVPSKDYLYELRVEPQ